MKIPSTREGRNFVSNQVSTSPHKTSHNHPQNDLPAMSAATSNAALYLGYLDPRPYPAHKHQDAKSDPNPLEVTIQHAPVCSQCAI